MTTFLRRKFQKGSLLFLLVIAGMVVPALVPTAQAYDEGVWYPSTYSCEFPNCNGTPLTVRVQFLCMTGAPDGGGVLMAYVYAQEHGKSGVTRLRYRIQRDGWDAVRKRWTSWTSWTSVWQYSKTFPNNGISYYKQWPEDGYGHLGADKTWRIKVKVVGERPALHQPDVVYTAVSATCTT